jgi:RNA polymerase sigma factor (sigma-70 family)
MTTPAVVLRHLRRQFGTATPDADLLHAYAAHHDADAFRAVVERHGPMILGVCRRRLGDDHAADDAFQATFLVLARNARGLRRPDTLATWLYKVAVRICGRARRLATRRRDVERCGVPRPPADPAAELTARELLDVLDNELLRLPERYRRAVWLVYWQGLPHAEAAARLNLSPGALHGRLDRGRKRLADRLRRRGFGPDAAARALLVAGAGAVAVPADLTAQTVTLAAAPWLAATPAAIVSLAANAATSKVVPATALVVLLAGTGMIGVLASWERERPEAEAPQPRVAHAPGSPDQPSAEKAAPRLDLHGDPLPPGAIARLGTVRMRHPLAGPVAVLPDGRSLASIGRTVKVWDLATGKLLREFGPIGGGREPYGRPAVSPDGRSLAFPGLHALDVWDLTTGRLAYSTPLNGIMRPIYAYSPDGRLLVSGADNRELIIRDAATGKLLRSNDAHRGSFTGIVFAGPDRLVTSTNGRMLTIWDVATATIGRQIRTEHERVAELAATADGKWLASVGDHDRKVRLWDLTSEREVGVFDVAFQFDVEMAFSPDGKTLAAAGGSGPIYLWDVATRRGRTLPLGHEVPGGYLAGGLRSLAFSPDGRLIVGTDVGQVVRCLDVATGRDRFASDEHAGPIRGLSFTPDGQAVRTGCNDFFTRTYDLGGRLLKRQPAGFLGYFAPDGRTAITCWYEEWSFLDLESGRTWAGSQIRPGGLRGVAFSPDGRTVVVLTTPPGQPVGPQRSTLQILETATGRLVRTLDFVGVGEVLKYTADGRTFAMVERTFDPLRESIHMWDAATGRTTGRVPVPSGWSCRDIDFSPDGRLVAAPRMDEAPLRTIDDPPAAVAAWVAILEVASGRVRQRLRLDPTVFADEIGAIRFAPNGRDVVIGRKDGTVRLWDLASGRERVRYTTQAGAVTDLALSPDGRMIASGHGDHRLGAGGNGTVLLWPLPTAPERGTVALPSDRPARDALWTDLGSTDAPRAGEVLNRLAADPGRTVGMIRERLAPAASADPAQIARWVADLDSQRFAARTRAAAELERLGELAEPALRKALAGTPSAEVKLQVERLLAKLTGPVEQPEILRGIRAVEVLERIATPDARALLVELAKGDAAARLTREATASLKRLK